MLLQYTQYQAVNIMVPLQDPRDFFFFFFSSVIWSHVQCKYRCAKNDHIEVNQSEEKFIWMHAFFSFLSHYYWLYLFIALLPPLSCSDLNSLCLNGINWNSIIQCSYCWKYTMRYTYCTVQGCTTHFIIIFTHWDCVKICWLVWRVYLLMCSCFHRR